MTWNLVHIHTHSGTILLVAHAFVEIHKKILDTVPKMTLALLSKMKVINFGRFSKVIEITGKIQKKNIKVHIQEQFNFFYLHTTKSIY